MTDREEQLKRIIRQMLQPLRDIPLDIIIEAITGEYTIWPYDGHAREELERIADLSVAGINAEGIEAGRPNEVGNYCEPFVSEAIKAVGGEAQTPLTASGRRKSTGYPDIEADILKKPFYIEVKTYNERNRNTTQRSFYISPSRLRTHKRRGCQRHFREISLAFRPQGIAEAISKGEKPAR